MEESEWETIEAYYIARLNKEKELKELAQGLVKSLTEQVKHKNEELEKLNFCVNTLAGSLQAACEAFHKLKVSEKAK